MDQSASTTLEVAKIEPITFIVTVKAQSLPEINEWKRDLRCRHTCIHQIDFLSGFDTAGRMYYVRKVRFTLRDNADYEQLCALRTELRMSIASKQS